MVQRRLWGLASQAAYLVLALAYVRAWTSAVTLTAACRNDRAVRDGRTSDDNSTGLR
jgi:hypothetical protein